MDEDVELASFFFIGKGRGIVGPAPLPDKIMMSSLYMFSLESDLKKI